MKPFKNLTRSGRLRRLRELAHSALRQYRLEFARFVLVRDAGNTLYRVYSSKIITRTEENELFIPDQYLLRLHWSGYRDESAIEFELKWLDKLRKEHDLPVPEPIPTRNGNFLIEVSHPGIPEPRYCSLLRWVKGKRLGDKATSKHYAAQGRFMARMHDVAQIWLPARETKLRVYDWGGLFRTIPALCLPVDNIWSLLPKCYVGIFEEVTKDVRDTMEKLGKGKDVFGLIHADLGVDANLLFWHGQPRAIDFDEIGLGYWVYDLAVALEHCREHWDYKLYKDALLSGYYEIRKLPGDQIKFLDLFMAALDVHLGLWTNAVISLHPGKHGIRRRLERCLKMIKIFLDTGRQGTIK